MTERPCPFCGFALTLGEGETRCPICGTRVASDALPAAHGHLLNSAAATRRLRLGRYLIALLALQIGQTVLPAALRVGLPSGAGSPAGLVLGPAVGLGLGLMPVIIILQIAAMNELWRLLIAMRVGLLGRLGYGALLFLPLANLWVMWAVYRRSGALLRNPAGEGGLPGVAVGAPADGSGGRCRRCGTDLAEGSPCPLCGGRTPVGTARPVSGRLAPSDLRG